jgi:hypothetical protein
MKELIAKWRAEADECEAFLAGKIPREDWEAPGDPPRIETRMYVLRALAAELEAATSAVTAALSPVDPDVDNAADPGGVL